MAIDTRCPNGHWLKIKSKYAGKEGLCPTCHAVVRVPLSATTVLPAHSILGIHQMNDSGVSLIMPCVVEHERDLGTLIPTKRGARSSVKDHIPLEKTVLLVGRTADCDIALESGSISRHHAELKVIGDRWYVEDNNSTNGVKVNGRTVVKSWLEPGDTVSFASLEFEISYSESNLAVLPPPSATPRSYGELLPFGGGDPISLSKRILVVGRCDCQCDIVLSHPKISRQHAQLSIVRAHWWVEDRESSNGVFINGHRVDRGQLEPGDTVAFGMYIYKINYAPATLVAMDPLWSDATSFSAIAEGFGDSIAQID